MADFEFEIRGGDELLKGFKRVWNALSPNMRRAMERSTIIIQKKVREQLSLAGKAARRSKASQRAFRKQFGRGGYVPNPTKHLRVQTGTLRRSIQREVRGEGLDIEGKVGPGGLAKEYATIHEFGGTAGRAKIPARPYMAPAFKDSKLSVLKEIEKAVTGAVGEF